MVLTSRSDYVNLYKYFLDFLDTSWYFSLLSAATCSSCLDTVTSPRALKCKHVLCLGCFQTASKFSYKCPVCQDSQGVLQGDQPQGEMTSRCDRFLSIPGYEGNQLLTPCAFC